MPLLIKLGLAALAFFAGHSGSADPPALAERTTPAVIDVLRQNIRADLMRRSLDQLHVQGPALHAATTFEPDARIAARMPTAAAVEPAPRRSVLAGQSAPRRDDRQGVRWQSFLPGMMK